MTYFDILTAIKKITSDASCPINRKTQLLQMKSNILKVSPESPVKNNVLNDFMTIAGYIGK